MYLQKILPNELVGVWTFSVQMRVLKTRKSSHVQRINQTGGKWKPAKEEQLCRYLRVVEVS